MPSSVQDRRVAEYTAEIERQQAFQNQLLERAASTGRDLTDEETGLFTGATAAIETAMQRQAPLLDAARIELESRSRLAEITQAFTEARTGYPNGTPAVEYRSAGEYAADRFPARRGDTDALRRVDLFNRAAAHQTTADNPGLLPESILAPIINHVDATRPLVTAIGVTALGDGSWAYASVTQHTLVGAQAGEKTELPSRKMTITKTPISAPLLGGYLNISAQDIRRTSPGIVDMVLNDMAGQYAIATEAAAGLAIKTAATAGPTVPATPTADDVNKALWTAAGTVFGAMKGDGTTFVAVSPDVLGLIGPLMSAPGLINPAQLTNGFSAGGFSQGVAGYIGGMAVVMSAGLPAASMLVMSSAAVRVFEALYPQLQVVEPSVQGTQVGYAGDFQTLVTDPAGVVKLSVTP